MPHVEIHAKLADLQWKFWYNGLEKSEKFFFIMWGAHFLVRNSLSFKKEKFILGSNTCFMSNDFKDESINTLYVKLSPIFPTTSNPKLKPCDTKLAKPYYYI